MLLAAAGASVISWLVISEPCSHENGGGERSHAGPADSRDFTYARTHTHAIISRVSSLTVLGLPPGFEAVGGEGGDHVLDGVAGGVGVLIVQLPGVADETFGLLLRDTSHPSESQPPRQGRETLPNAVYIRMQVFLRLFIRVFTTC